jgi:pyruvate dehydrogenase E2 component (dihydrolipoamide acetyltransferase)/2-oxoisovalerate dehydrogenase E2 component (dihydrolipoyl transacylase)
MEFRLPELGEGVYEAELSRWLIEPGAHVKPGQGLAEMLTDKASMEVPAPFAGTIQELRAAPGQQVKVGAVLLTYEPSGAVTPAVQPVEEAKPQSVNATPPRDGRAAPRAPVKAGPAVRLMARKLGIDLTRVQGSGPQGRVLLEDLPASAQPAPAKPQAAALDFGTPGSRIKFQGLRRKIAEHMVLSKHSAPHYSYVDECDVTDLVHLRESLREPFAKKGVRLTYLAFVVRAVVRALKEVPIVNASLDDAAGEIVLHDRYHIGVAVSTPGGLIVPVVHDADKLSLLETARELERLGNDARLGKVRLEDLRGGTFTITSIGNIGGLFATPIIHHPQVGILGVGKIVKRPVFDVQGQIKAAEMVYLSFSFDHRVLDGAIGASFGNAVLRRLQTPAALMIEE